jgi:hypothetical protein
MEAQEIVSRLSEATTIFQGVGAPFRRSMITLLEGVDLAAGLANDLQQGALALQELNKKIESTKVAELARADQVQADHEVKEAGLRERLAYLEAQVAEQAKKSVVLDLEINAKQAKVDDLDKSLAAHRAAVANA